MFKSIDGGQNFRLVSSWLSSGQNYLHADQHIIVFSPDYATDLTVYTGKRHFEGQKLKTINLVFFSWASI